MIPWSSSGDVLRWWREDVLGMTQRQAAEHVRVRASSLSNWERGVRSISIDLADLDEALKGEHVLEGLLWGYGTPDGLDPGHRWTKVFPGPSRPVWLWIRSPSRRLAIAAEWGLVAMKAELELGPNGIFIAVGASVADSPVVVHLSKPGWADFGFGELPTEVPGAPILTAISLFERSTADGPLMDLFSSSISSKLLAGSAEVQNLADLAPEAVDSYVRPSRDTAQHAAVSKLWAPDAEGIDEVERKRFVKLRIARDLSRAAAAARLTERADRPTSRDTLRRFERGIGEHHDPMLPIALDHVLGADGRLAALELRNSAGSGTVNMPGFWRGPIWIRVEDESGRGQVVLRRGNWHRELTFDGPTVGSAHWFDPSVPFRIVAPPTTRWAVGVGRRAGAEAIDQNWVPTSVDTAQQAVLDVEQTIFTAVDRRR